MNFSNQGFEDNGLRDFPKMSSKTGDQFATISDLPRNEEHFYFKLCIGNSVKSLQAILKSVDN